MKAKLFEGSNPIAATVVRPCRHARQSPIKDRPSSEPSGTKARSAEECAVRRSCQGASRRHQDGAGKPFEIVYEDDSSSPMSASRKKSEKWPAGHGGHRRGHIASNVLLGLASDVTTKRRHHPDLGPMRAPPNRSLGELCTRTFLDS